MTNKMIDEILNCDRKIYLSITGGGTGAISKLLEGGGASGVFVGANIPYAERDLCRFIYAYIQREILKCCSKETAKDMADAALEKCTEMGLAEEGYSVGLGCTASLCKYEKEREGRINQAFICVVSNYKIVETHVEFLHDSNYDPPQAILRKQQECMLSTLILGALADFVKPPSRHIESHIQSNPYVRIQSEGRKLDYEEKSYAEIV